MKKLISLSLSLIFVLTTFFCVPFYAWADGSGSLGEIKNPLLYGNIPDGYNDELKVTKTQREVARELRCAMVARDSSFEFTYSSDLVSVSKLTDYITSFIDYAISDELSMSCVDGDYIHYQWSGMELNYTRDNYDSTYDIGLEITYRADAALEYQTDLEIKSYLSTLDMSSMSDYEILKEFHDYIIEICDYNFFDMENENNYNCAGVFLYGKSVCQGYSLAFYRLCKEAGFDVRIIQSDPYEGCHGWNLVYIGDAYYYVDTTWDDDYDDQYAFFLVDYETLQSMDDPNYYEHKLWGELYDDDEYFNTNYRPYISNTVYDSSRKSISNCKISVDYENPTASVVTDSEGNVLIYGIDYEILQTEDSFIKINGLADYAGTSSKRLLTVNGMTAKCDTSTVSFNGEATTAPPVAVEGLEYGVDYIVSSPNGEDIGECYSVIEGIGKYTGVLYSPYNIEPIDINTLSPHLSFTSTYYNGKYQQPTVLFEGAPGEVYYSVDEGQGLEPGTYTMTVTGTRYYTGTVSLTYEIVKGTVNDFEVTLSSSSFVYDGREKKPRVSVSPLTENTDYIVSYSDNISTGVAVATVTGIGYFGGSRNVYYYILPNQTRTELVKTTQSTAFIRWQSVSDVSGYLIEIYSAGAWSTAADVSAQETSALISNLASYTTYRFRVTPYKYSRGQTVYAYPSNEVSALTNYVAPNTATANTTASNTATQSVKATAQSTAKATAPKKASISKLKASKKAFTVKWKKLSCTGYQIQYSTSKKFTKKKTKTVTVKGAKKTSKKISKLKKGKRYYVRVRAYKTVNGKKIYGSWSTKKSVKVK